MENKNKYNDLYEDFVQRLISGDYNLYDTDRESTELLFNTQSIFPDLNKIPNYLFKINYLSDALSQEISKLIST